MFVYTNVVKIFGKQMLFRILLGFGLLFCPFERFKKVCNNILVESLDFLVRELAFFCDFEGFI
jgi:hypothetical protein